MESEIWQSSCLSSTGKEHQKNKRLVRSENTKCRPWNGLISRSSRNILGAENFQHVLFHAVCGEEYLQIAGFTFAAIHRPFLLLMPWSSTRMQAASCRLIAGNALPCKSLSQCIRAQIPWHSVLFDCSALYTAQMGHKGSLPGLPTQKL
eukprot:306358-Amphidinium_carterae.1